MPNWACYENTGKKVEPTGLLKPRDKTRYANDAIEINRVFVYLKWIDVVL